MTPRRLRLCGDAQARVLVLDTHTQQLVADLSSVLSDMQSEEDRLYQFRDASLLHMRRYAILALWGTGGLGVVLIVLVVSFTRRDEAVLRRTERELATTLRSIGDAVIATDRNGCVRFMNPIAERLTGWPDASARGRRLAEVFRAIGEETRSLIESPVNRVLQQGARAPLADHPRLRAISHCPL